MSYNIDKPNTIEIDMESLLSDVEKGDLSREGVHLVEFAIEELIHSLNGDKRDQVFTRFIDKILNALDEYR